MKRKRFDTSGDGDKQSGTTRREALYVKMDETTQQEHNKQSNKQETVTSEHVSEPGEKFKTAFQRVVAGTSGLSKRRKHKEVLQPDNLDECSTSDDASTLKDEEEDTDLEPTSVMPQKVRSRPQDRWVFNDEVLECKEDNVKTGPPMWVQIRQNSVENLTNLSVGKRQRRHSGENKRALRPFSPKPLKKYSSTGDLSKTESEVYNLPRRILPDLSICQKIANQENVDMSDTNVPATPSDRKTLEAQFKLLYCENVKLDRAYGDLQEKVRSQSPQLLNSRFNSPRELDLQNENKKLQLENQKLKEELLEVTKCDKSEMLSVSMMVTPGSLSPPSEKTETYWKDAIKCITKVKDDEILRLSDQVAYWMEHANSLSRDQNVTDDIDETTYIKPSTMLKERVAELEQSEAQLKCQILNLEDQLVSTKSKLAISKTQNDDLGDHCAKLEGCLSVIDAEKMLLDDLKLQNGYLRNELAETEKQTQTLVGKLAQMADEKADIELKLARSTKEKDLQSIGSNSESFKLEMDQLKIELSASNDRCAGLEDVKECLIEQIKALEEEINGFEKQSDRIKDLNSKIRKLNAEKAEIVESHDKLQLDKDLNSDMSEKLNQRISDLQGHIETLKSQLDHQKNKIIAFDQIQEQLEHVMNEKCTLEAACEQLKNEKQDIKNKLTDQQEKLSESFERANTQLMLETNEMATRQRDLLTDVQQLRVRSQTRGVEAMVGTKFLNTLKLTIRSCKPIVESVNKLLNASTQIQTSAVPFDDFNEEEAMLDHDAISILSGHIKEVDGLSLQQFVEEQNQSPRPEGIISISQLRTKVKECHEITTAVTNLKTTLELLLQQYNLTKDPKTFNKTPSENDDIDSRLKCLQNEVKALKIETENLSKKNNLLSFKNDDLLGQIELFKNASTDNKTLELLTKELEQMKRNSKQLNTELEDSRFTCKMLSEKMMEIQEKSLLKSEESVKQEEKLNNLETVINETKGMLETAQLENEMYRSQIKARSEEQISTQKGYDQENSSLLLQLQQLVDAKLILQKDLNGITEEKDKLVATVDMLKSDKNQTQQKHLAEIQNLQAIITANDMVLKQVKDDLEKAENDLNHFKTQDNETTTQENNEILQEKYVSLDKENSELKVKLDEAENEKSKIKLESSQKLEELQKRLKYVTNLNEEKDILIDKHEKSLLELTQEIRSNSFISSETKRLEMELEASLSANNEMKEEIKVLIQLQKQETLMEEKSYVQENKKLANQILELEAQLLESEKANSSRKTKASENNEEFSQNSKLAEKEKLLKSLTTKLDELSKINAQLVEENSTISAYLNKVLLSKQTPAEFGVNDVNISDNKSPGFEIKENVIKTCIEETGNTKPIECSSTACLQCKTLLSEVECLRAKCLQLENELIKMEKQISIDTSNENKSIVHLSDAPLQLLEKLSAKQTTNDKPKPRSKLNNSMENLISFDNDLPSIKSSDSVGNLSTTESNVVDLATDYNQSLSKLTEENAKLLETIKELNAKVSNTSTKSDPDYITILRNENVRLQALLEKRKTENQSIKSVQNASYASSTDLQSDTESDPEAERKFHEHEQAKELEMLQLENQEMKCLVVAHKRKLDYVENANQDLSLENGKMKEEIKKLKSVKLPSNPFLNDVLKKIDPQIKSLASTAPAVLQDRESTSPRDFTPCGSMTENGTIPFDAKNKETDNIERLSTELEEAKIKLHTMEINNKEMSVTTIQLKENLHLVNEKLNVKQNEVSQLESILEENEADLNETKLSKEKEIKNLRNEVNLLEKNIKTKTNDIAALKLDETLQTEKFENQLSNMKMNLLAVNKESEKFTKKNQELLNKTCQIEANELISRNEIKQKNQEIEKINNEKQSLIKANKIKLELKENELKETIIRNEDLEKTTAMQKKEIQNMISKLDFMSSGTTELMGTLQQKDEDITVLSTKLKTKHEEIEVLSARVGELTDAQDALQSTMENADDMILEREKVYKDEVEELKQGLNKTLSESLTIQKSNEELLTEIYLLEKENEELKEEINLIRSKESDVAQDIEAMEMERELMNTSLDNAREDADDLIQKNQQLTSLNFDLEQDIAQLEKTIKTLNHQILDARDECENLELIANEKQNEIEELRNKCNNLKSNQVPKFAVPDNIENATGFTMEYSKPDQIISLENDLENALQELEQTKKHLEQTKMDKENFKKVVLEMEEHQFIALASERSGLDDIKRFNTNKNDQEDCETLRSEANELRRKILFLEDQISEMKEHQVPKLELGSIADESDRTHQNLLSENKLLKRKITELKESLCLLTERLVPKLELGSIAEETDRTPNLEEENRILRKKISNLESGIFEMTERLVPKLDLGSICEEEEHVSPVVVDDDTCRDVEECDVDTERETLTADKLENRLKCSEENSAKLLLQVQEMEEENDNLKANMEELAKKNENLQKEFFETIHEDFQSQMDELNTLNSSLKGELCEKDRELTMRQNQLKQISAAETQWRKRYQEVQHMAEELRLQLQRAEVDNQDLQCRLIDLDEECQKMGKEDYLRHPQVTNDLDNEMKEFQVESCAQTLSWSALVQLIKEDIKDTKKPIVLLHNELEDQENGINNTSKLHNEFVAQIPDLTIKEQIENADEPTKQNINREKTDGAGTTSKDSSSSSDSESDSDELKSIRNDVITYQRKIDKLRKENQELLDGTGSVMTQEDREALEHEVSALRGQVALLERNNRIFSDRERTDLKKDLAASNKRCNAYQTQLLVLRRSLEYEEVEKLKKQVGNLQKQIAELQSQLDARSSDSSTSDNDSDDENPNRNKKYVRLLELEEEAEELNRKLEEKDKTLKDRNKAIENIQTQLDNVKRQHQNEARELEKKNLRKEAELNEEIKELSKQIDESKEIIKLKQANFEKKCEQLGDCEAEVEQLQRDVQRKENEIKRLNWEIESLHKENKALRDRINNLKIAISNTSDPNLSNFPLSPLSSVRSNSNSHLHNSKLRSFNSQTSSPEHMEVRRGGSIIHDPVDLNRSFDDTGSQRGRSISIGSDSRARSSLREGILEAKQTVNDIGDVLDTPRTPLRGRSPVTRQAINVVDVGNETHNADSNQQSPNSSRDKLTRNKSLSPIRKSKIEILPNRGKSTNTENTERINSSSSVTPEKQVVKQKKWTRKESPSINSSFHTSDDKSSLVVSDHAKDDKASDSSVLLHRSKRSTSSFTDEESTEVGSLSEITKKDRKNKKAVQKKKTKNKKPKHDLKSPHSSKSSSHSSTDNNLEPNQTATKSAKHQCGTKSLPLKQKNSKPETLRSKSQGSDTSYSKSCESSSSEAPSSKNTYAKEVVDAPNKSNNQAHLVNEVAKARSEARKWFKKVAKADRDKAVLDGRMEELKNELRQLAESKNKTSDELKSKQSLVERQSGDLEVLRAQAEIANRKAEEAREKSALLRAHLMDKEEVANINRKLTKSMQELKETSLSQLPGRTFDSNKSTKHANRSTKNISSDKELNEIREGFEYIANNFASLVLKKHDTELLLGPTQAKVSKLKRKCLERDQILAKLVIKLKKQQNSKTTDDVIESNDESVTTSMDLDDILSKADHVVRCGVLDSDESSNITSKPKQNLKPNTHENIEFLLPMRPPSSLLRSLSEKSPNPKKTSTTHRVYVAKKDYIPASNPSESNLDIPVTHSLLPDLALLTGDTAVAIGRPDTRSDGKLYQLCEVHGKIGFVPFSHLVAAEQVDGMQSYLLERGKTKPTRTVSSSPEKIANLYKKLAEAQNIVADRLDRTTWAKPPCRDATNRDVTKPDSSVTSSEYKAPLYPDRRNRTLHQNENKIPTSVENELEKSRSSLSSGVRSATSSVEISTDKMLPNSREHSRNSDKGDQLNVSNRSFSPIYHHDNNLIRTSTPINNKRLNPPRPRRSSSLPPRRSSSPSQHSDRSTPGQFITASFSREKQPLRHSSRGLASPLGSPEPPSFIVIEKTMGQKSMIISWTPPLLDMISRSNNIPVIAYEISIDQQRKVQIAGAYTNKAILGDLDLRKTFTIQVRTVSSLGTLSTSADVVFTPNMHHNHSETTFMSSLNNSPPIIKSQPYKKDDVDLPRNATVLYDYDPVVDSPYKSHKEELKLRQGDSVIITGQTRSDGFCKAKVGKKSGFVPISFLLPNDDVTSDDTDQLTKPKVFLS